MQMPQDYILSVIWSGQKPIADIGNKSFNSQQISTSQFIIKQYLVDCWSLHQKYQPWEQFNCFLSEMRLLSFLTNNEPPTLDSFNFGQISCKYFLVNIFVSLPQWFMKTPGASATYWVVTSMGYLPASSNLIIFHSTKHVHYQQQQ